MKKLLKNTGSLLLTVATMVIVLHLLIPHDHHQESLCFHAGNTMPAHENHRDHPAFPSHCHAFNDLDSQDKHVNVSRMVSMISITAICEENVSFDHSFSGISFLRQREPRKPSGFFISPGSLRAPPVIS